MISDKTVNRDSKPEDWASSVNFLTILCYELPVKNQRLLQTDCDDAEFQSNPPYETGLPSLRYLSFLVPVMFYWEGGKKLEEGKGFFCGGRDYGVCEFSVCYNV